MSLRKAYALLDRQLGSAHGANPRRCQQTSRQLGFWPAFAARDRAVSGCRPIPLGDGQWKLFNIKQDIREATDLSKEHPDILEKMVSAYDEYAQNVGIILPKYSEKQKKGVMEMLSATNQTEFKGFPLEKYLAGYPAEQ